MGIQSSPVTSSSSSDWDGGCIEPASLSFSCDSIPSPLDLPGSLLLGDEYWIQSNKTNNFEFDYQPWPYSEPLMNDEILFPSEYNFDSMIATCTSPLDCASPLSSQEPQVTCNPTPDQYTTLSPVEQARLLKIAMPLEKLEELPWSPSSVLSDQKHNGPRKRKSPLEDDEKFTDKSTMLPSKRGNRKQRGQSKASSHNLIEKRYRTNLNQRIVALRDS